MSATVLHIKNMVCNRCIKAVDEGLKGLGFTVNEISLGEVKVQEVFDEKDTELVRQYLQDSGFELIDDKKSKLINRLKTLIIEYIHYDRDKPDNLNLSDFLASEVQHDYSYISNLFSSVEGVTIEKYVILQKIEKVKELLVYDELTLSEISNQLDYSSAAHLSAQFKKITGLTPSHFRNIQEKKRKPLDEV